MDIERSGSRVVGICSVRTATLPVAPVATILTPVTVALRLRALADISCDLAVATIDAMVHVENRRTVFLGIQTGAGNFTGGGTVEYAGALFLGTAPRQ